MKLPLSWLKRYLDTNADLKTILDTLTSVGLEVEGVENPADKLQPFQIARVLTAAPHPQADRLQVLEVDVGDGSKPHQVVCGAPNARAGLVGVFGPPGAYIPGSDFTLKLAEIRGVASSGMMCSARELELGEDHDGIIELSADAPVGANYAEWAGLDDPVIEIAITPNRQDCMGIYGIARDLAAAGIGKLKPLNTADIESSTPISVPVATDDPEGCPALLARSVSGVKNGPSPQWLQDLLTKAGLRPISALVDVTNYFTMAHGRPLHVYDVTKIEGTLRARKARYGEELLALNDKTYKLDDSMTVIADDKAARSIAGIMGGEDSSVGEDTTEILVEAAWFAPAAIGAAGRKLGLTSDSRARFERGVDPAFVAPGLDMAVAMIQELCGGRASDMMVAGELPDTTRELQFDPKLTLKLGGIEIPADQQRNILVRLGFTVSDSAPFTVGIASWRRDVDGPADLVEEVVRIFGIDKVQSVALPRAEGVATPTATPEQIREQRLKRQLAARGLNEVITWSFIPEAQADLVGGAAYAVENPLSAELAVMRPSLLPGLTAAAARNAARGRASAHLFESGRRYLKDGEHPTVALLLAGEASPRDWRQGKARTVDVFDLKALLMDALAAAGAPADRLQTVQPASEHYHPGRSAQLRLGKAVLAEFGELHPRFTKALDLDLPAVAGEIFLDALPQRRAKRTRAIYQPSPLQPVRRDFAFLVPASLTAEQLLKAVSAAEKKLVTDISLFDRFEGGHVPEGKVSLAISVTLQPEGKSLTDTELEAISAKIVAAAAKLGAELRG